MNTLVVHNPFVDCKPKPDFVQPVFTVEANKEAYKSFSQRCGETFTEVPSG